MIFLKHTLFLLIPVALFFAGSTEKPRKPRTAGILFYNVENLFDTLDDKSINDNEFLPKGQKQWNSERYLDKLDKISDVFQSISTELPIFIGLSEIENRMVLNDLSSHKMLKSAKYGIAHFDSPDARGIDVGFLYSRKKVKSVDARKIPVSIGANNRLTRDILLVKCELKRGPDVYFFVNHWPSRYGGQKESEPKRIAAAKVLGEHVDSLISLNPNANIICMGDFNDYPDNHSIQQVLIGERDSILFNLMPFANSIYPGSYSYKGEWGYLDQFIATKTLYDSVLPEIIPSSTKAFSKEEMIYITRSGNHVPNKTYGRNDYYGGYSDHLPVYTELVY